MTITERFLAAVESIRKQVESDASVIALLLAGSLSYGTVWEKSDIDLTLLVRDGTAGAGPTYYLDEDGINVVLAIMEVSKFKNTIQRVRGGAFSHSYWSKGRFIFTKDETLPDFLLSMGKVGKDDAALTAISEVADVIGLIEKVEKWLLVYENPLYAQRFLQICCHYLANFVLLTRLELPDRESILRAAELEPDLMSEIYITPSTTKMTAADIRKALQIIDDYLVKHIDFWSAPVLRLLENGEVMSNSEIAKALRINSFHLGYLAEKGKILRLTQTARLFKKGRATVEEIAYMKV